MEGADNDSIPKTSSFLSNGDHSELQGDICMDVKKIFVGLYVSAQDPVSYEVIVLLINIKQ